MADAPPVPRPRPRRASAKNTDTPDATDKRGNGGNREEAPPRVDPPKPQGTTRARPALEEKLGQFFGSFSLFFAAAGDDYCAQIVAARAPALAQSWAELAKENASVKRVLERLLEGSAWGGVILNSLAIGLPIAAHHGLYRGPDPFAAFLPGPPPPTHARGQEPPPGRMAWGSPAGGGGQTSQNGETATSEGNGGESDIPIYQDGAPPGVVTVARGPAGHPGAH